MSGWENGGWYTALPKKPPPKDGISIKKAGSTWWGQRWIEALENVLRGDAGRLARGRTYARAGRTSELVVHNGKVTAKVTGSRTTPYKITIELTQLGADVWKQAIVALAQKAHFSAALLSGQMPQQIDEVFREAGGNLFPAQRNELKTSCTCPDWGDPCKHIAATHYVLGEALDGDPFLLFELRGQTKAQVLASLRAARGEGPSKTEKKGTKVKAVHESAVPAMKLGKLTAQSYDLPRAALPTLHFSFEAPTTPCAVLLQLGLPAKWEGEQSPAQVFSGQVRAAADMARRLAMAEPSEEDGPSKL